MTDGARFLTKKFGGQNFKPNGPQLGPKIVFFCHFSKFGSLIFLQIAYDDSLQQCLTSSTDKIYKTFFGPKRPKLGPKLGFLPFSQVWFIRFSSNCIQR